MLRNIELYNFKSHKATNFGFKGQSAAIIGPNASGKTNLLESIYYSFLTKPLTGAQADVINRNADFTKVITTIDLDKPYKLEYRLKNSQGSITRTVKLNDVKHKPSELIGMQPVVVFVPDDVQIISGGPTFRRNYLNSMIIQTQAEYLQALNRYQKLLGQRNRLLYGIKNNLSVNRDQLFVYNLQMSLPIEQIYRHRYLIMDYLNSSLGEIYSSISGGNDKIHIEYLPTLPKDKDDIIKALEKHTETDIRLGFSSHGPHKDDFIITLNGLNTRSGFSRGENRSLTLALKAAELNFIRSANEKSPILLLDDVLSELDAKRQSHLLDIAKKQQTIITSTAIDAEIKDFNIIRL